MPFQPPFRFPEPVRAPGDERGMSSTDFAFLLGLLAVLALLGARFGLGIDPHEIWRVVTIPVRDFLR